MTTMKAWGDDPYKPKCTTDSTKPGSYTMDGKTAVAPGDEKSGGVKSKKRSPKYL